MFHHMDQLLSLIMNWDLMAFLHLHLDMDLHMPCQIQDMEYLSQLMEYLTLFTTLYTHCILSRLMECLNPLSMTLLTHSISNSVVRQIQDMAFLGLFIHCLIQDMEYQSQFTPTQVMDLQNLSIMSVPLAQIPTTLYIQYILFTTLYTQYILNQLMEYLNLLSMTLLTHSILTSVVRQNTQVILYQLYQLYQNILCL